MTNQVYLDRADNSSGSHLSQLPHRSFKKAGKIALWSSLIASCAIAIRQQPLLSLPVSGVLGLSFLSQQQQTKLEKKLTSTNVRLEKIDRQYSQLLQASVQQEATPQNQEIEQIQQQLNLFSDRLNTVSKESQTNITPTKKRVAIFIDGANLYYAINKLRIKVDYTKLLKHLVGEDSLYRATYYTGIDSTNNKELGFLNWLGHHGFHVVTKELVKRTDGSKKANLDIEMALDMVSLASHYDKLILIGGDGDFACALKQVSSQGCQIEVVSLKSSTSEALIKTSDRFTNLQDIVRDIRKA